jgi:hypothetical protein
MLRQFLFLAFAIVRVAAEFPTRIIRWEVSRITASPDGVSRSVLSINGHWPPRPVWVNRHDHVVLQVHNLLNDSTVTVHTHGIDQVGTTYWDGVDMATQWYPQKYTLTIVESLLEILSLIIQTSVIRLGRTGLTHTFLDNTQMVCVLRSSSSIHNLRSHMIRKCRLASQTG